MNEQDVVLTVPKALYFQMLIIRNVLRLRMEQSRPLERALT